MLFNYFFTNAMPHCMPFTFFMSDVTVEMVVLVELLPSVFKSDSSLLASVTNCITNMQTKFSKRRNKYIKICLFELFYILKDYVVVKK